jgi:hypothetical protein
MMGKQAQLSLTKFTSVQVISDQSRNLNRDFPGSEGEKRRGGRARRRLAKWNGFRRGFHPSPQAPWAPPKKFSQFGVRKLKMRLPVNKGRTSNGEPGQNLSIQKYKMPNGREIPEF